MNRPPFGRLAREYLWAWVAAAGLLGGCVTHGLPPVADRSPVFSARPDTYQVRPIDTLYSIAWRFDLDYRAVARANGIPSPYTIHAGQVLKLKTPAPARPREPSAAPPKRDVIRWRWPGDGSLIRAFGSGNNGLDYQLRLGSKVRTAAAGAVVYAGSGLGGFRHLVIVKHSDRYLSAYGLNVAPAVAEGDAVKDGAVLADIPYRGRSAAALHFEIRMDGEPLNPKVVIR